MGAWYNGIKSRDFKPGMHGVDHNDLHAYGGQGRNTVFHLHSDVVIGKVGQLGNIYGRFSLSDEFCLFKTLKLGQTASHIVGVGIKVTSELCHLRQGPA